jgi:glycosyltransferase involved in cell wall biosynthesis
MPILATKVGHFPETIQDGFNGYLAEPNNIDSMANQMRHFLAQPIDRTNVAKKVAEMSWVNYAKQIMAK